jgi:hypothetical protein
MKINLENQDCLRAVLKEFSRASYENYQSYAYSAGYLESLCLRMLPSLPKRVQRQFIDEMVRATGQQREEYRTKYQLTQSI